MSARVPYLTWSANNTFSQWGGDWLRTWNPAVGDEKPADSSAYWYTSANDVFLLHVYGLPGLSLLVWALCKNTTPWPVAVRRAKLTNVVSGCWQRFLAATDMVLRALCLVALSATVYYKIAGERVAYLGQPCHWLCGLLAFLSFRSDSDKAASPIFNFVINCMYGPILAMLMPDNAENRGFENINFWLEHVVLFTLPIVWMARRRFHIYGGAANVVVSWAIFFIVHGAVLTPWSILSGRNIDYMMMPPPKYPASLYPQWYRHIVMCVTLGFGFFTRFAYTGGSLLLTGAYSAAAAEARTADVPSKPSTSEPAAKARMPSPGPGIEQLQPAEAQLKRPVSRQPRGTAASQIGVSDATGPSGGAGAMPEAPLPLPAEVIAAAAGALAGESVATEAVASRPTRSKTPAGKRNANAGAGAGPGPATAKKQALMATLNGAASAKGSSTADDDAAAASASSGSSGAGTASAGSSSIFRFTPYKSPSRIAAAGGPAAALHRGAAGGTPAPSRGRKLAAKAQADSDSESSSDSESDSHSSTTSRGSSPSVGRKPAARSRSTAGGKAASTPAAKRTAAATPSRRTASKAAAATPARRTASKAGKAAAAASATPAADSAAPRTATRRKASASARK